MATTNFPNGVTNVAESAALGSFIAPDPTKAHVWFDEFDKFHAVTGLTGVDPSGVADWSLFRTFTGTPTAVISDADGGILTITNGTADNDHSFARWKGQNAATAVAETFRWAANRAMWFKARFKVSDATESDLVIGLQISDTSPLDVTDGLFFSKVDGSTSLIFNAEKDNAATTKAVGTLANDTYVTVAFVYLPKGNSYGGAPVCHVYFNDVRVGTITSFTNFPDDEDLTVSFGIQNGETAVKVMSVDYIFVAKQRDAEVA